MMFAIVNVLPLAGDAQQRLLLAPLQPLTSASIASGWSPVGWKVRDNFEFRRFCHVLSILIEMEPLFEVTERF